MSKTYVVVYKEFDELKIAHIIANNYYAAREKFKSEYSNVLPVQMYLKLW